MPSLWQNKDAEKVIWLEGGVLIMALWQTILLTEIIHNFIGGMIIICIIGEFHSFDFLNPIWIYRDNRVNIFGAAVLCLSANIVCPIISICYWFYKLCTVGR